MKKISILVVSIALLFSSCGLIKGGFVSRRINIKSKPSGVTVYRNGINTGKKTPCHIFLRRKKCEIRLKKEEYKDYWIFYDRTIPFYDAIDNVTSFNDITGFIGGVIASVAIVGVALPIDLLCWSVVDYGNNRSISIDLVSFKSDSIRIANEAAAKKEEAPVQVTAAKRKQAHFKKRARKRDCFERFCF